MTKRRHPPCSALLGARLKSHAQGSRSRNLVGGWGDLLKVRGNGCRIVYHILEFLFSLLPFMVRLNFSIFKTTSPASFRIFSRAFMFTDPVRIAAVFGRETFCTVPQEGHRTVLVSVDKIRHSHPWPQDMQAMLPVKSVSPFFFCVLSQESSASASARSASSREMPSRVPQSQFATATLIRRVASSALSGENGDGSFIVGSNG
jgi:hypothetical protein